MIHTYLHIDVQVISTLIANDKGGGGGWQNVQGHPYLVDVFMGYMRGNPRRTVSACFIPVPIEYPISYLYFLVVIITNRLRALFEIYLAKLSPYLIGTCFKAFIHF